MKNPSSHLKLVLMSLLLLILTSTSAAFAHTLSGTVYGGSAPLPDATVLLSNHNTENPLGSTVTDASGDYQFVVDDGVYDLDVQPPAGSIFGDAVVESIGVSGGDVHQDVILIATTNGHTLSGVVRLPDGTPMPGVDLTFYETTGDTELLEVTTDATGSYSVSLPADTYRIDAWKYHYGTSTPELIGYFWYDPTFVENLILNGQQTLDLTLPYVWVTGKTTDANGVPVAAVEVGIAGYYSINGNGGSFWGEAADSSSNRVLSDANGQFGFWVPAHDDYTVMVFPPEGSGFPFNSTPGIDFSSNRQLAIILPFNDTVPPVIISGPLVTQITDTTALVEWQTDEPATSTVAYGMGSPSGNTESPDGYRTLHSVLLTDLSPETTYQLQVSSSDRAGNGPTTSEVVSFTTMATPDTSAPVILEGPIVTSISHDSAVVEWTTNEAATSEVNYGLSPSLGQFVSESGYVTHHSVSLTNLSPNSQYSVLVSSSDEAGNGPTDSQVVDFWTLPILDNIPPVIISGPMVIDITDTEATVIWETDESAVSGVSYNDGTAHGLVRDENLVTRHSVRLTNLAPATLYYYTVSSTDALGNGPTLSEEKTFTTLDTSDHQPPIITEAVRVIGLTHHSAMIFWKTDEPASAVVEYGLSEDALDYSVGRTKLKTTHTLQLTDLYMGMAYYFRVRSSDAFGNEVVSEIDHFTTHSAPKQAAAGFVAAPQAVKTTDTEVTLSWETDEPTDAVVEYKAVATTRSAGGEATYRRSDSRKAKQHQVTLTGLTSGADYNFSVNTTNTEGEVTTELGNFVTGLSADTQAPTILSGPTIVNRRGDYAVVIWATDEVANSSLVFGETGSELRRVAGDLRFVKNHIQVLTNLKPSTDYAVRVTSTDIAGNSQVSGADAPFTSGAENDATPPVLTEITTVFIDETEVMISWGTNEYASVMILYGTAPDKLRYIQTHEGLTLGGILQLDGLDTTTAYYFKVVATDPAGNRLESEVMSFGDDANTETYTVDGTVFDLAADNSIILQNNAGDDLTINGDGIFTFSNALNNGGYYNVTVQTQPSSADQACSVAYGNGVINGENITDIEVTCVTSIEPEPDTYTVGGVISGLESGTSVTLQNNAGNNLVLHTNDSFTFASALADDSHYEVTVLIQPDSPKQTCSVASGSGTIAGENITSVKVTCVTDIVPEPDTYTVGGTLSGLALGNSVTLQNNSKDSLTVSDNGNFTFAATFADKSSYQVSALTQPTLPNQSCSISRGSGTIARENITSVEVTCVTDIVPAPDTYTVGGTISGLISGSSVTLRNNAGDDLRISANGIFAFSTALVDGSNYHVTVLSQPAMPNQICNVTNGNDAIHGGNVTSVNITCEEAPVIECKSVDVIERDHTYPAGSIPTEICSEARITAGRVDMYDTTSVVVPDNARVIYTAQEVLLKPGFRVKAGGMFQVKIAPVSQNM